jgi:hypothetical protein
MQPTRFISMCYTCCIMKSFETSSNPFGELRERVRAESPGAVAANTPYEMHVSPADKVRFQENQRFAGAVYEGFKWLSDQGEDLDLDMLQIQVDTIAESLTPQQRQVFEGVISRIKDAHDKVDDEYIENGKAKAIQMYVILLMTAESFSQKTREQVYEEAQSTIESGKQSNAKDLEVELKAWLEGRDLEFPDIDHTKLGAFVMRVSDPTMFKQIGVMFNGQGLGGMKIHVTDRTKELFLQMGFTEEDIEFLGRTIVVDNSSENKDYAENVEKHELFHDLYDLAIAPETETVYSREEERNLFLEIKNELLAYLFANRSWNYDVMTLGTSFIHRALIQNPELQKNGSFNQLLQKQLLKERISGEGGSYTVRVSDQQYADRKTQEYTVELLAMLRQVARLHLLRNQDQEIGVEVIMAAQSFKEIAFQLSQIEAEQKVDVVAASRINDQGQLDLRIMLQILNLASVYAIPIANPEDVYEQFADAHARLYAETFGRDNVPENTQLLLQLYGEVVKKLEYQMELDMVTAKSYRDAA